MKMNLYFYQARQRITLETTEGNCHRPPLLASALYCFDSSKSPPGRSLGGEMGSTLGAMAATAPMQLNLEQKYGPQYMGLDLSQLQTFLKGDANTPGYIKLLGDITPQLDQINSQSDTAGRSADVADLARLGPGARDALRAANPSQAALLDRLNSSALTELQAGRTLTPAMKLALQQSTRGAQAARGMGFGPSDVLDETLGEQQFGDQLLQSRQRFGTTMTGVNQSTTTNPILELLTRLRNSVGQGTGMLGTGLNAGRTAGPNMFDPLNSYASDLYNTNYNADAASRINRSNNNNALIGSGIGAVGHIAGAAMAA